MAENFKCSICLEFSTESKVQDYFVSTRGGHIFHFSCIQKLILQNKTGICPNCREPITLNTLTRLYGVDPNLKTSKQPQQRPVQKPDCTFKFVLLGNSSVGKSCLLKRFSDGVFYEDLTATTGCDVSFKTIEVGGKRVKLNIWDTVGQEKFRSIANNYVRNAQGILLVYDVTDVSSLNGIHNWLEFVEDSGLPDAAKVLIGNKTDIQDDRKVTTEQGKALADLLGLSFFETSAKDSFNVEMAFRHLAAEILATPTLNEENTNSHPYDRRLQLPNTPDYYDDSYQSGCSC